MDELKHEDVRGERRWIPGNTDEQNRRGETDGTDEYVADLLSDADVIVDDR